MKNVNFSEADLKDADLCLTNLENASFSRAKMQGAKLLRKQYKRNQYEFLFKGGQPQFHLFSWRRPLKGKPEKYLNIKMPALKMLNGMIYKA
jgi:hypothetical protein